MDKLTGPNSTESGASLSAKEMDACVGSIADYFGDYLSAILKGDDVQNLIFSTKPIKMLKALISVPDILLMRKVERFCKGLQSLSEIDRDRYARRIGKLTSEREHVFLLNVINKTEEEEKLVFLANVFVARTVCNLDEKNYRRLMLMIESTMFDDLVFLLKNYKKGPVTMETSEALGLLSEGWVVYGAQTWGTIGSEDVKIYEYTKMAGCFYSIMNSGDKAPQEFV